MKMQQHLTCSSWAMLDLLYKMLIPWCLDGQVGDAALVRVALHAPSDGHVALGSVLSGTLDFRASQEAAALNPEAPRCIQVCSMWKEGTMASRPPACMRSLPQYHWCRG